MTKTLTLRDEIFHKWLHALRRRDNAYHMRGNRGTGTAEANASAGAYLDVLCLLDRSERGETDRNTRPRASIVSDLLDAHEIPRGPGRGRTFDYVGLIDGRRAGDLIDLLAERDERPADD